MRKIYSLLLTAVLIITVCVPALAEEQNGETEAVEIVFSVGDSTLLINGESVTVETPYVVGDGVTLVPLRVITEAFGADVSWNGETRTVTLDYPDIKMLLKIGSSVAEINGIAEMLPAAPELTAGGVTMVPLRFISETFGAEIKYDEKTKKITVVKKSSEDSGSIIEGAIENEYIGDSFYGWTMQNPKNMELVDLSASGDYVCWRGKTGSITVSIWGKPDDYDAEEKKEEMEMEGFYGDVVKSECKETDENNTFVRVQKKNNYTTYDFCEITTDRYLFNIDGMFFEEGDEIEENCEIITSFITSFSGENVYDLSNVKDGMREYKFDSMKYSLKIPQDYILSSDETEGKEVYFYHIDEYDNYSFIAVNIYSKDSVIGSKDFAERNYQITKRSVNEAVITEKQSEVKQNSYNGFNAYEYEMGVKIKDEEYFAKEVFLELGEYVYLFCINIKKDSGDYKEIADKIVKDFSAEELDFEETGTIMFNKRESEMEGTRKIDEFNRCSFEVPYYMETLEEEREMVVYEANCLRFEGILHNDADYDEKSLHEKMNNSMRFVSRLDDIEITTPVQEIKIGKNKFLKYAYTEKSEEDERCYEVYMILHDSMAYEFKVSYWYMEHTEYLRGKIENILSSIEFR